MRPFLPPLLAGALARGNHGIDFDRGGFGFLERPWFLLLVLALAALAYVIDRPATGRGHEGPPGSGDAGGGGNAGRPPGTGRGAEREAAAKGGAGRRAGAPVAGGGAPRASAAGAGAGASGSGPGGSLAGVLGGPVQAILGLAALALGALLFAGSLAGDGHAGWPGLIAGAACAVVGYFGGARFFARARRRLEPGTAGFLTAYADGIALALAAVAIFLAPVGYVALVALLVLGLRLREEEGRKFQGLRILR